MPRIKEVRQMLNGHLGLEFEDGTQAVIARGEHEELALKPGDSYPPEVASEPEAEEIEFEELADEEHEEDLLEAKPKKHAKKAHHGKKK